MYTGQLMYTEWYISIIAKAYTVTGLYCGILTDPCTFCVLFPCLSASDSALIPRVIT